MGSTAHLYKNFEIGAQPGSSKISELKPDAIFAEIVKNTDCVQGAASASKPA